MPSVIEHCIDCQRQSITDKMIPEHNKIYELLTPSDNDADDLFNYLYSDDIGGRWLEAPENTPWEVDESRKRNNQDLISLTVRRTSDDVVTKGMNDSLAYSIHKFFGKRKVGLQYCLEITYNVIDRNPTEIR